MAALHSRLFVAAGDRQYGKVPGRNVELEVPPVCMLR
jgi:hypothetical protein